MSPIPVGGAIYRNPVQIGRRASDFRVKAALTGIVGTGWGRGTMKLTQKAIPSCSPMHSNSSSLNGIAINRASYGGKQGEKSYEGTSVCLIRAS
jgi:hypothetical protein